jgi:hypothetical protein
VVRTGDRPFGRTRGPYLGNRTVDA